MHGVHVVVRSSRITPTNNKGQKSPLFYLSTIMYTTYILYSKTHSKFYTGQTENLDRRLEEHNRGKTMFMKKGMPWTVV
jgi:hypothetical protein